QDARLSEAQSERQGAGAVPRWRRGHVRDQRHRHVSRRPPSGVGSGAGPQRSHPAALQPMAVPSDQLDPAALPPVLLPGAAPDPPRPCRGDQDQGDGADRRGLGPDRAEPCRPWSPYDRESLQRRGPAGGDAEPLAAGPARDAGRPAASPPPGGAGLGPPGGEAGAGAEPARRLTSVSARTAAAPAAAVLEFWFAERCEELWFARDNAFDTEIRAS